MYRLNLHTIYHDEKENAMLFSHLLKIARFQLIFMALAISALVASSLVSQWVGKASSPDSKKPQYTEVRTTTNEETGAFDVEYMDANGKVFAVKSLKIPTTGWHPEIDFTDNRNSISYSFKHTDAGVMVEFKSKKESYTKVIQAKSDFTWDSGIHFYILQNFDNIIQSDRKVEIFLPEYGKAFSFTLKAKLLSDGQHLVTMQPSNMFLKLFVDELKVWYKSKKYLTKYEGISDIKDAQGDNYNTVIDYALNTSP